MEDNFVAKYDTPSGGSWKGEERTSTPDASAPLSRVNSRGYSYEEFVSVLWGVYDILIEVDPNVKETALQAYKESFTIQDSEEKCLQKIPIQPHGKVNRRAPLNPLASPRMGKFRKKVGQKQQKLFDPALKNNPLRGRLVMLLTSSAVLLFIFLQSLCFNKTEYSTFHVSRDSNSLIGPSAETLLRLGGLSVNRIRNNNESFRLFWSMWMHAGWIHMLLNIVCQLQYLFMFEPDWGMIRVMLIYLVSGITGNLLSAVCNPCTTTVGSSGALFGLMGAMITYCLEFWSTIPRPRFLLIFSVIVVVLSLLTGFTSQTDNWAHMGGLFGGICTSLATLPTATICNSVVSYTANRKKDGAYKNGKSMVSVSHPKKTLRRGRLARFCQMHWFPRYRCGRWEWLLRITSLACLFCMWIICFSFIYIAYEYTPLGQMTFKGLFKCYCCYEDNSNNWYCRTDDYMYGGQSWDAYCAKTTVKLSLGA